jgi:hypothetical protein
MSLPGLISISYKEERNQPMKAKMLCMCRFSLITVLLIGLCAGCASLEQLDRKIQNSSMTRKAKNWQSTLQKKFDGGHKDPQSSYQEKSDENKDVQGEVTSANFIHTVQLHGETLAVIAEWYTGTAENARTLVCANPEINPERIHIGSQVKIPERMLKTREPMSAAFTRKHRLGYHVHQIRWPGENLSLISKWYTGRYNNWKKLIRHNPKINLNRLKIGQKIYIPDSWMKTHQSLPEKYAAKALPGYFAHTVKRPGERLTEIAGWYTGHSKNWQIIARANPDLDPESLRVGNKIYIPSKLLKTRKPIPQISGDISGHSPAEQIPSGQSPESEAPAQEPAKSPEEKIEYRLFGPKKFPKG